MGRSNVIDTFKMFDSADISSNQTSPFSHVKHLDKAEIILDWSGSGVDGEIIVEARHTNSSGSVVSPWVPVNFNSQILMNTDSGQHSLILRELPFAELRIRYVRNAGTGSLTAYLLAKSQGA